ncbi:MAG TPA: TonB-dependent siderophore receptor [Longimicrobiales bacterium]|nr:TonB-dependent siderophore receptor [Longimicrobiales bacterium]
MHVFACFITGCALAGAPTAGGAARPALPADSPQAAAPIVADTTVRLRFSIPVRPLGDALWDFSRQAGVRVELDTAAAAGVRSHAVSGTYTAPEALRRLLAGTGLTARFTGLEMARVIGGGADGLAVHALAPLTVIGARSRGYAALRTTTATRTDTPLRDAPQSVSVVTRQVIADQAMQGMADVVRYVPGITMAQGEGHRDAPTIRGNNSTADFFVDGVRDDAQYFRDLYNVERVEALKGSNAMIFGRGGGGGVINRTLKEARWPATRALTLEGGSFEHKRATLDVGQGLGAAVAARLNGVYEASGGFREAADLRRYGINPTFALAAGPRTMVRAGYELFDDRRTVDRGIPSFQGRPADVDIATFFGNPEVNRATLRLNAATASVEHATRGGLTIRNRTRFADYDKFYQNTYPGAVNAAGTQVALSAYNHAIGRRNVFNQTDVVYGVGTGGVRHTLLLGAELGRQETSNFRGTGYYDGAATSVSVPVDRPTVATPVIFRQSATDADNGTTATVAAVYVQDQLALSGRWQAVLGLRLDRFAVDFHDNRSGADLGRDDRLISPRAGLVFKPVEPVSLYGSYSVSYLPSSGDQFGSLTATTRTLEPERFTNREIGAKWEVRPELTLTAAAYRLERTNTAAPDPSDPSRLVQTGSQRTTGLELEASGNVTDAWQVIGGVAAQRAEIVSTTRAAAAGASVPLVPRRTFSLWNRYQLLRPVGVGLGVVRQSAMYAAIDNTVTLPGFTRVDGALFLRLGPLLGAQLNVENLLDERYYPTSQGNNNIMPGAPRTLRISITTGR